jgi:uncharacterized protein YeaO (DUF488 family)
VAEDRANDPNRVFDAEELRKHMGMHHDEVTVEKFQGKYYPEMQKAQEDTNAYLAARAERDKG